MIRTGSTVSQKRVEPRTRLADIEAVGCEQSEGHLRPLVRAGQPGKSCLPILTSRRGGDREVMWIHVDPPHSDHLASGRGRTRTVAPPPIPTSPAGVGDDERIRISTGPGDFSPHAS